MLPKLYGKWRVAIIMLSLHQVGCSTLVADTKDFSSGVMDLILQHPFTHRHGVKHQFLF